MNMSDGQYQGDRVKIALLTGAGLCWAATITLSCLIINKTISQIEHPGVGLIVFMTNSAAITLTIVWANFRIRHLMAEAFRSGLDMSLHLKETEDDDSPS